MTEAVAMRHLINDLHSRLPFKGPLTSAAPKVTKGDRIREGVQVRDGRMRR